MERGEGAADRGHGSGAPPLAGPGEAAATPGAQGRRRSVRVALVNDYDVIVAGILGMLAPYQDRIEVIETDVGGVPRRRVDVALFDTYGQAGLGVERIRALADDANVGAVAVYTWSLSPGGRAAALAAGARAFLAKGLPASALVEALEAVAAGDVVDTGGFRGPARGTWPGAQWQLSARESEIVALLAEGMPNRAIAASLYISENTVRTHLKSVFRKLGVTTRSQAVVRALSDPSFQQRAFTATGGDGQGP